MIEGGDTAQEVSEMNNITVGDMINNSLVIDDEQSANSVAETPDSEEISGAEEICCVCEVRVGVVSISAVLVRAAVTHLVVLAVVLGRTSLVLMDSIAVTFPVWILGLGVPGAGWTGQGGGS